MTDFIADAPCRLLDAYAKGTRKGYGSSPVYPEWQGQEDRDYLGASKAGDCRRKMWFTLAPEFEGEPLTDEKSCIFSDGYLLEADTRTRLQIGGLEVGASGVEYVHPDEPRIRGHIDGIVGGELTARYVLEHEAMRPYAWYVLEHKAMRSYPFQKFIGEKRGEPFPLNASDEYPAGYVVRPGTVQATNPQYYDQVQVLLLLKLLHTMKADGLDLGEQRCLFVARSKETGRLAVEEIVSDYEHGEALIERMRLVLADFDAGRISPKDYDPSDSKVWQCQYCEYRRECVGIGDAERMDLPDDDQNPEGDAPCPQAGCGGTMRRRNRRGGTPETGLIVLVCSRCEYEEAAHA